LLKLCLHEDGYKKPPYFSLGVIYKETNKKMKTSQSVKYGGPKGRTMRQFLSDSIYATINNNHATVDNSYATIDNNDTTKAMRRSA